MTSSAWASFRWMGNVLAQLGVDVFDGEGWEAFDRGERQPPVRDSNRQGM